MPNPGRQAGVTVIRVGSQPPAFGGIDPAEITDRDGTVPFALTGTNLDHGVPTLADDEGAPGGIEVANIVVVSDTSVTFDGTVTDGVSTIGTHTLTYTNDNGSFQFQVEVTDG